MSLKTLFLNNPKFTNILIILLVAFNLLFVIGWVADSHHHHRHYNGGEGDFHQGFRGGYGGGFAEGRDRFGRGQGKHHHRGFGHHHHHHGFENQGDFESFQDRRNSYGRHDFGGNFHAHGDSTRNGRNGWGSGKFHAQGDSTGHRHSFRHERQG